MHFLRKQTRSSLQAHLLFAVGILVASLLSSCAGEGNYHPVSPGEGPPVPRIVELRDAPSVSTYHFPAGLYALEAEDDRGYYYRAPRQVMKHAFAGAQPYDGGLFVRKGKRSLRGYVVWAGGRTKIGDLAGANYNFRD